ncbi:MAG: hypothetical protein JF606_19880 [Burkholderiales bacterium]|nr:hypothetical protein [Burkholderiales bacterium]
MRTSNFHSITVRFLRLDDVPALIRLEQKCWTAEQAADGAALRRRIRRHPQLCVGAFDAKTGEALASLFMKPVLPNTVAAARRWHDCAQADAPRDDQATRSLFGISLTSVEPRASWSLIRFFWPHALRHGWRDIYLGSPIPGLARTVAKCGNVDVEGYVNERRGDLPRDPQLRYYHRRGFREVVAVRPGYFPHEQSMDYGVVLRGRIPLSRLWPLWRCVPLAWLQRMSGIIDALT